MDDRMDPPVDDRGRTAARTRDEELSTADIARRPPRDDRRAEDSSYGGEAGPAPATPGAEAPGPRPGEDRAPIDRAASLPDEELATAGSPAADAPTRGASVPDQGRDRGDSMRDGGGRSDGPMALFPRDEADDFRSRWESVQAGFVDEPRQAVQEADSLVAGVIQRLADGFADERTRLEQQWARGEDVSTEELRIALQRYRSFFNRLLSL